MLSPSSRACRGTKHEASDIVAAARGWIGTPFAHKASVKGVGCDCLGLVRGVWRELFGAEPEAVPAYAADWSGERLRDGLARHLNEVPRAAMRGGDVALFRLLPHGPARHCGIVGEKEGGFTLIHARQNRVVREEPLSRFWQARLVEVFRLRG
ncbi:MAG: C40 family peptidase [Alphaproteobacteria bacterium]|nr:C40 family peptidase [Alphaproteobacteria bacterium]